MKEIFLGNGQHSINSVNIIKEQLNKAVECLGGIQQLVTSPAVFKPVERCEIEEAEEELISLVTCIVESLGFEVKDKSHNNAYVLELTRSKESKR